MWIAQPTAGMNIQMTTGLLLLFIFTFTFAVLGKRLSRSMVTAPMFFLGLGYLFSVTATLPDSEIEELLYVIAEITLVVVLFLDAAQLNLSVLRQHHVWPVRMLV